MKKTFLSKSPAQTKNLGKKLAANLKSGDVIGLIGQLGAGKTVFSQGVARGLGVAENVTSASFVLVQKFKGRLPFYHLDFYRLSEGEIDASGFEEIFDSTAVSVVEWAEKDLKLLPPEKILVKIDYLDEKKRRLTIEAPALKLKGI